MLSNKLSKLSVMILVGFMLMIQSVYAFEQKVVQGNGLYFWTESFGDKKGPALVLIMGSGGQGLLWPQAFCERLAEKGFYVIRYDHRDVGLSSAIDYKKAPYSLVDMAKDVTLILDSYNIKQAHIVGGSMGGQIGMLFAANYPKRTQSLTLIMTSPDMRATFDALEGKKTESKLSGPSLAMLASVKKAINPAQTMEDKVQALIQNIKITTGSKVAIDETLVRELALESIIRGQHNPLGVNNHFFAAKAVFDVMPEALSKIKAPTKIIHGDQDPIFGVDHAKALNQAIPQSKLVILPDFGHALPEQFYDPIIENIVEVSKM